MAHHGLSGQISQDIKTAEMSLSKIYAEKCNDVEPGFGHNLLSKENSVKYEDPHLLR